MNRRERNLLREAITELEASADEVEELQRRIAILEAENKALWRVIRGGLLRRR